MNDGRQKNGDENSDDEFMKLWLEYYNAVIVEERKKGDYGYFWEGEHVTLKFGSDSKDSWEKTTFGDNVTYLDIHNESSNDVGKVNDTNLVKINSISKLGYIGINRMPVSGAGFKALTNLKNLKCINIKAAQPLSKLFEHVHNFPDLRNMYIYESKLSYPNWRNLLKNDKLKSLCCNGCSLTDDDLASFPSHPNIDSLYFQNNDLTCLNFSFIKDMPQLKMIDIWGNHRFNIEGLRILTEAGQNTLMDICFQDSPLIDDSCIKYFLPMEKIQTISFTKTNITEKGLEQLKDIPTLRYLFLPDQISVEFVKDLQEKYMPQCHFMWSSEHTKDLVAIELSEDYD
ncbi:MAG: hypothetical protein LBT09_15945 [Planctomycetaceae bacterium]|jgi:hypothetical protein|nr:hypothetical protein [Planctomycetaceae bacterium]